MVQERVQVEEAEALVVVGKMASSTNLTDFIIRMVAMEDQGDSSLSRGVMCTMVEAEVGVGVTVVEMEALVVVATVARLILEGLQGLPILGEVEVQQAIQEGLVLSSSGIPCETFSFPKTWTISVGFSFLDPQTEQTNSNSCRYQEANSIRLQDTIAATNTLAH
jgi:hypothetical protein